MLKAFFIPNPSNWTEFILGKVIDVSNIFQESGFYQLFNDFYSQTHDVHCTTRDEMFDISHQLSRASRVHTVPGNFASNMFNRFTACRTDRTGGEYCCSLPFRSFVIGPITYGMTSPARFTNTRSPTRISFSEMKFKIMQMWPVGRPHHRYRLHLRQHRVLLHRSGQRQFGFQAM